MYIISTRMQVIELTHVHGCPKKYISNNSQLHCPEKVQFIEFTMYIVPRDCNSHSAGTKMLVVVWQESTIRTHHATCVSARSANPPHVGRRWLRCQTVAALRRRIFCSLALGWWLQRNMVAPGGSCTLVGPSGAGEKPYL
jgi:hypothetical protein